MNFKHLFFIPLFFISLSACTVSKTGADRYLPDKRVQLEVTSLYAKSVQEQGVLGSQDGDELTLVYTLNAYDEKGNLVAVNNGFWGTRTIGQDTRIPASEFEKISVHIPKGGKVIAALSLLEIDDFKGERKMDKVRRYSHSERYPKALSMRRFDNDRNLPPLELIAQSLDVAGYNGFMTKQMNVSTNDDLGGKLHFYDTDDLAKISSKASTGSETLELDGKRVNENYLYVIKYDLDVLAPSR